MNETNEGAISGLSIRKLSDLSVLRQFKYWCPAAPTKWTLNNPHNSEVIFRESSSDFLLTTKFLRESFFNFRHVRSFKENSSFGGNTKH